MQWNKKQLKKLLLERLQSDLDATLQAATTAHEGATHSDAQAKSKYDTHGLELSYIAGSQYERARAMQTQIKLLEAFSLPLFAEDEAAEIGALVTLRREAQSDLHFLLLQLGAGVSLSYEGVEVQVISPESPLGERLLGLSVGDSLRLGNKEEAEVILLA